MSTSCDSTRKSPVRAYKRDLKNIDFNLYDAGHFALETHGEEFADKIRGFLDKHTEK